MLKLSISFFTQSYQVPDRYEQTDEQTDGWKNREKLHTHMHIYTPAVGSDSHTASCSSLLWLVLCVFPCLPETCSLYCTPQQWFTHTIHSTLAATVKQEFYPTKQQLTSEEQHFHADFLSAIFRINIYSFTIVIQSNPIQNTLKSDPCCKQMRIRAPYAGNRSQDRHADL